MRVITQQRLGGPEVLTVVDAPEPRPLPTEVVVRVEAIGLNPIETWLRSGDFPPVLGPPPFVLGWDVSGVVVESLTWRFRPGDEVFGMPMFPRAGNAYAELLAAPGLHFARKPASLSPAEAAALPVVGLTAWQALVDVGGVTAGDRVLVHGGGGGVGHVAVQIAKARGAYVIATASGSKREFVEGLGTDEVVDYTAVDFAEVVRDVDVVLDTIGGDTTERSLPVLRPGGHLVTAVAEGDTVLTEKFEAVGLRFSGVAVDPDAVALQHLVDLVDRGALRVHVQETFPFDRVADAHRLLDAGHLLGKVVLTV